MHGSGSVSICKDSVRTPPFLFPPAGSFWSNRQPIRCSGLPVSQTAIACGIGTSKNDSTRCPSLADSLLAGLGISRSSSNARREGGPYKGIPKGRVLAVFMGDDSSISAPILENVLFPALKEC